MAVTWMCAGGTVINKTGSQFWEKVENSEAYI